MVFSNAPISHIKCLFYNRGFPSRTSHYASVKMTLKWSLKIIFQSFPIHFNVILTLCRDLLLCLGIFSICAFLGSALHIIINGCLPTRDTHTRDVTHLHLYRYVLIFTAENLQRNVYSNVYSFSTDNEYQNASLVVKQEWDDHCYIESFVGRHPVNITT